MSEAIESPELTEEIRWALAKDACCSLGLNQREASEKYGLSYDALRKRCEREEWPLPERVSKAVTVLSHNRLLVEKQAETWLEKGEKHRSLAYKMAHSALQDAASCPPEVKDWSDVERIDKMARRAAGLDNGDSVNVNNQFNFAMLGGEMDESEVIPVSPQSQITEE
jgi:hypothetical protein